MTPSERHEDDTGESEQLGERRYRHRPLIDRSHHDSGVNKVVWWVAGLLVTSNLTLLGSYVIYQENRRAALDDKIANMFAQQAGYQAGVTEKILALDRRLENVERMLRERE